MLSIRRKISVNRGKKNTGDKRQPGQSVFRIRFKKIANTRGAKLDFFSFSILNFPSSKIEWLIRINFDSIVFKWCWIFVLILRRSSRYIRSALIYHVTFYVTRWKVAMISVHKMSIEWFFVSIKTKKYSSSYLYKYRLDTRIFTWVERTTTLDHWGQNIEYRVGTW